jgi:RES domain-containing protein
MIFAALYTALSPETALGELIRHITPELLPSLNGFRLSRVSVTLVAAIDCRDPSNIGLRVQDLTSDGSTERTREIGAAAHMLGADGLLVPSATLLGDNLILFPDNFSPSTRLTLETSIDPRLYIAS